MTTPPHLLPTPGGLPPRIRPADAMRMLAGQLRQRGLTRLYGCACDRLAVLSVTDEVTVWTNGRVLWWRAGPHETTWPAADASGAARLLTDLPERPER